MDPKQCLLDCLRAVIAGNGTTAREHGEDYEAWRKRGGHMPDFTADALMRELSNYF